MGGVTAELVRGVFFKSRSAKVRDGHERNNLVEKKRWSSVKSYLCGDECNSVLEEKDSASDRQLEFSSVVAEDNSAHTTTLSQFRPDFTEEDTTSIQSSEATVTQPIEGEIPDKSNTENISNEENSWKEKQNSTYKLFQQEDAAMTIQSAFRSYLARRSNQEMGFGDGKQERFVETTIHGPDSLGSSIKVQTGDSTRTSSVDARCSNQVMDFNDGKQEHLVETTIHSPESLGTSIKVQTGDSTGTSSVDVESIDLHQLTHKRVRVQVAKLQEDWDDSTVSSTISKIRIQNRIEAATRRERALAYAFAQQLRVCAKKKHTKSKSLDTAMSQSWLERWMATRQPENSLFDNKVNKRIELHSCNDGPIFRNKLMEATAEEESCGSNEISTQIDGNYISRQRTKYYLRPTKSKGKAMRNMSRQQFPGIHRLKEPKVHKNCYQAKDEKGNNGKQKHLENKKEMGCQDFI